ncbi:MAG: hypothetical protein AMS24_01840 [Chlamydiae bacterium SM23_39]|nr:MAG: hypothetical protein AMS24_01840 [Chlamydiae bacterium SM23_39]
MKNKYFLILPVVLASIAFTQEEKIETEKPQYDQGYGVGQDVMAGGYNTSARIDVKGAWDYYISGSFIYWQPKMYLPYAWERIGDEAGTEYLYSDVLTEKTHLVNFDYHPGFKVGLGTNTDMDDWNLFFEYTRLTTSDTSSTSVSEPLDVSIMLYAPFYIPEGSDGGAFMPTDYGLSYVRARSKFYINLLDMELGRPCYVGTKLTFKPYVGARAGWIKQKNNTKINAWNYGKTEEGYVYLKEKSDTWLLGPRVGLDTNWHLGEGFRLFGNVAASLFYQHYKIDIKQVLPVQTNTTVAVTVERLTKEKVKDYLFNPCFEAFLGFGWGKYFSNHEWHVDLSAGYEIQYFLNQYYIGQIKRFSQHNGDNAMPDLTLHGLTVSLRFDF